MINITEEIKRGSIEIALSPVIFLGGLALENSIEGSTVGGLILSTVIFADGLRRISKISLKDTV